MILRTFDLLNYLRCRRFAALDSIRRLNQTTNSNETKKDSFTQNKINSFYPVIEPEEELLNSNEEKESNHFTLSATYLKYYQIVQTLLKQKYTNEVLSTEQDYEFSFRNDITLSIHMDFKIETAHLSRFLTLSMSSSTEFLKLKYHINKKKSNLFYQDNQGIYHVSMPIINTDDLTNYYDKFKKITNRHTDLGRMVYDLAFKQFVLKRLYPNTLMNQYLILVHSDYVYDGNDYTLDFVKLFDFTEVINSMQEKMESDLYRMINHIELRDDSRCLLVKNECLKGTSFQCEFVDYCFSHVPETNSLFAYFSQHVGFKEGPHKSDILHDTYDLINEGVVDMLDIPISWLQREKNLMQRYCVENEYTYLNKKKITAYIKTLKYPLIFLDFEAYPSLLPRFYGETPYTQSVFQFSIHIQNDPSIKDKNLLIHHEFLSKDDADHREELVDQLLLSIPKGNSNIIVYNETFERGRLLELSLLFPKQKDRLLEISSRLFDLLKVLKTDIDFYIGLGFSKEEAERYNYYHPLLSGNYSLKKVLPLFDKPYYDTLPINNGVLAYTNYALLPLLSEKDKKQTIKNLLNYCKQDTLSMFSILEGIKKMLK
ncbi:MAG: DUF2779 domain-containing protein [Firmicutes bacterium]|nr:DUF2779 domain-containing protein [Bacillota bacterium]